MVPGTEWLPVAQQESQMHGDVLKGRAEWGSEENLGGPETKPRGQESLRGWRGAGRRPWEL